MGSPLLNDYGDVLQQVSSENLELLEQVRQADIFSPSLSHACLCIPCKEGTHGSTARTTMLYPTALICCSVRFRRLDVFHPLVAFISSRSRIKQCPTLLC